MGATCRCPPHRARYAIAVREPTPIPTAFAVVAIVWAICRGTEVFFGLVVVVVVVVVEWEGMKCRSIRRPMICCPELYRVRKGGTLYLSWPREAVFAFIQ